MSYQILIVDDDREFRQEMHDCLSDYQVFEATNGQQALDILKKPHALDLIILDIVMPGLSGLEALKQIKKIAPDISVVILTGQSSKDFAIEALKAQANDYIEKPFEVEQLLETIHRCLTAKVSKGFVNSHGHEAKFHLAKQFIERNWDKMITLEDVASQVCMSPKYFSRVFKEKTGLGFNEYRLDIKIKEASRLLLKSDFSIGQLSEKLGYKNLESFIRVFKRSTGLTPHQYRQKHDRR